MSKADLDRICMCLVVWVVLVSAILWRLSQPTKDSGPVPSQQDALMHFQYARTMATGHPYEYHPGDARSTGGTSHLYIWLLALLHRLGAEGGLLVGAAFWLNACFYGLLLILVWAVVRRVMPGATLVAVLLCALSGQILFTVFSLTDMGLFMVLTLSAFAAALYRRHVLLGAVLVLASLTRPEGLFLALALAMTILLTRRERASVVRPLLAALAGMGASGVALCLNRALTGTWQYYSILHKGYFGNVPLGRAVLLSIRDLFLIAAGAGFGLAAGGRRFYAVPLVGGLLAVLGWLRVKAEGKDAAFSRCWWLLSVLVAAGLAAWSGWQGIQFDRHLAWVMPVWLILIAAGTHYVTVRIRSCRMRRAFLAVLILYQASGFVYFADAFRERVTWVASAGRFTRSVDAALPPNERFGGLGLGQLKYYAPTREFLNLYGIVSPQFALSRDPQCALEVLKHRSEYRFDKWFIRRSDVTPWMRPFVGPLVAREELPGHVVPICLYEAHWRTFEPDAALAPASREAIAAVQGLRLVDRLDVGYVADERRCKYRVVSRAGAPRYLPAVATGLIAGQRISDVGQLVVGWEECDVDTRAGKDLLILLRTASRCLGLVRRDSGPLDAKWLTFDFPLRLRILVGGEQVCERAVQLARLPGVFDEVVLRVPGSFITSNRSHLVIGGDHVSYGYWFYQ